MFEDSLVESRVSHASSGERMTAFASICVQFGLAGLVIALPLTHPETLSFRVDAPRVLIPLPPKPPIPAVRVQHVETSSAPTMALAAEPVVEQALGRQSSLLNLHPVPGDAPSATPVRFGDGLSTGVPNSLVAGDGRASNISVTPARNTPLRVSSGISQGMLLTPIHPVYPAIAKAAGVQGTVVVEAIISRAGTIESLRVVSGPAMLQGAAVDAIRAARYRPYRLNGEPTEVQTTFTVNFRMGG